MAGAGRWQVGIPYLQAAVQYSNSPLAARLSPARLLELIDPCKHEMTGILVLKRHLYSQKTWEKTDLFDSFVFITPS
jgi:hypothetical protein